MGGALFPELEGVSALVGFVVFLCGLGKRCEQLPDVTFWASVTATVRKDSKHSWPRTWVQFKEYRGWLREGPLTNDLGFLQKRSCCNEDKAESNCDSQSCSSSQG